MLFLFNVLSLDSSTSSWNVVSWDVIKADECYVAAKVISQRALALLPEGGRCWGWKGVARSWRKGPEWVTTGTSSCAPKDMIFETSLHLCSRVGSPSSLNKPQFSLIPKGNRSLLDRVSLSWRCGKKWAHFLVWKHKIIWTSRTKINGDEQWLQTTIKTFTLISLTPVKQGQSLPSPGVWPLATAGRASISFSCSVIFIWWWTPLVLRMKSCGSLNHLRSLINKVVWISCPTNVCLCLKAMKIRCSMKNGQIKKSYFKRWSIC